MVVDVHCSLSMSIQNGITPLMAASGKDNVDMVHALIEAHADVHSQDKVGILANQSHDYVMTL